MLVDPRGSDAYTLLPRIYQGASPMKEALWTLIWITCGLNPGSGWPELLKNLEAPLVPIGPSTALSLNLKGVQWVHLCHPRLIYHELRRLLSKTVRQQTQTHEKAGRILINIYENTTVINATNKYKILMNGYYIKNFIEEVKFFLDHSRVRWNNAKDSRCGACKYTLTNRQRGIVTIQNLGRGIGND